MNFRTQKGFTLIELMVVVAIVGILTALAYPTYLEQVRATRRDDAAGALEGLANAMERDFTENVAYRDLVALGFYSNQSPIDASAAAYYNLTVTIPGTAVGAVYTLTATRAGPQVGDRCGDLLLDSTGGKRIINQNVGVVAGDCWF